MTHESRKCKCGERVVNQNNYVLSTKLGLGTIQTIIMCYKCNQKHEAELYDY